MTSATEPNLGREFVCTCRGSAEVEKGSFAAVQDTEPYCTILVNAVVVKLKSQISVLHSWYLRWFSQFPTVFSFQWMSGTGNANGSSRASWGGRH